MNWLNSVFYLVLAVIWGIGATGRLILGDPWHAALDLTITALAWVIFWRARRGIPVARLECLALLVAVLVITLDYNVF